MTPPKVPGATSVGPASSVRSSFWWCPTGVCHSSVARRRVEADDARRPCRSRSRRRRRRRVGRSWCARGRGRTGRAAWTWWYQRSSPVASVEGDGRVGVEVRPGPARPVRELGGARERRRVGDAPVARDPRSVSIDGGYHAPPPELTSGLPQRSRRVDRVERPAHLAGGGVERVDDAAVAALVDAADADGHGADVARVPSNTVGWMSMPVVGVAVMSRAHSSRAGLRRRARRRRSSRACRTTRPSATATPNGPMLNPYGLGLPAQLAGRRGRAALMRPLPSCT